MKTRLALIPVLMVAALFGCGDPQSTADNTEAKQLKERIASLEKKLESKQKPDSAAETEAKKEAPKRAVAAATHRATPAEEIQKQALLIL